MKREEKVEVSPLVEPQKKIVIKKINRISKWFDGGLVALIISLLIAAVYIYIPRVNHKNTIATPAPSSLNPTLAQLKKETTPNAINLKYHLNGVFLSEKDSIAMINDRAYKLGDMLNGMKIVSISLHKVMLQNDDEVIELTQV